MHMAKNGIEGIVAGLEDDVAIDDGVAEVVALLPGTAQGGIGDKFRGADRDGIIFDVEAFASDVGIDGLPPDT